MDCTSEYERENMSVTNDPIFIKKEDVNAEWRLRIL